MKAKIKATGEVVEILKSYTTNNGYSPDDLSHKISILLENGDMKEVSPNEIQLIDCNEEFVYINHECIDWEQRRYELAKAAMQGFIANTDLFDRFEDTGDTIETLCSDAVGYANSMIERLKGGQG